MIESSMMINDRMPEYTVERAANILNRFKKPLNGSNILILGVAYKKDIDDYRESPALKVIELLEEKGAQVKYFDPHIEKYRYKGITKKGEPNLSANLLEEADLVIITTSHSVINYELVQRHSKFVFDTRNATERLPQTDNIELL
jgi:UDP-N-acetyl-D-glucosamine dehydrogenase